jgi:hypothetical protein
MRGTWGDPSITKYSTHYLYRGKRGGTLGYVVVAKEHHEDGDIFAVVGNNMLGSDQRVCSTLEEAKDYVEERVK